MPNLDAGLMLLVLLTILDLIVLGAFILFMKKVKNRAHEEKLMKATDMLESIVTDAGQAAQQLREELEKKQELMRRLNAQMDERIMGMRSLCNKTQNLLRAATEAPRSETAVASLTGREKKIIALARTGRGTDEIAGHLALAREEVELVLGLENRLTRLGAEKGRS